jgi:hypothetical protein
MTIEPIYLHDWKDGTSIDVFTDFDCERWSAYREADAIPVQEKPEYQGVEIMLAYYSYENYSGDAFVLFRRDGKLYEVNGGHCSCYGLEGQWEPEETTAEALRHRIEKGGLGKDYDDANKFADELSGLLDAMEARCSANAVHTAKRGLSRARSAIWLRLEILCSAGAR